MRCISNRLSVKLYRFINAHHTINKVRANNIFISCDNFEM